MSKLIGFACGVAIWVLSPQFTGRVEPWDAKGVYYWAALFVAGLIPALIEPKKFKTIPLWVVAGQSAAILGGVVFGGKDIGLFLPMGLIVLFLYSVVCYAGAFLGAAIRKKVLIGRRPEGRG